MMVSTTKLLRENIAEKKEPDKHAAVVKATVEAIKDLLDQNTDFFKKVGSSCIAAEIHVCFEYHSPIKNRAVPC